MRWNPVLRVGMAVAAFALVATACGEIPPPRRILPSTVWRCIRTAAACMSPMASRGCW